MAYEAEMSGFWIDHPTMVIDMNESKLETIEQIREFLAGTADSDLYRPERGGEASAVCRDGGSALQLFLSHKGHRGVLFAYMQRLTGYSRQHLSRLLAQYRDSKSLRPASGPTGPALPASTAPPMWRCWPSSTACTTPFRARPPRCWRSEPMPASVMRAMLGWPKYRCHTSTTCAPVPAIASNASSGKRPSHRRSPLAFAKRPRRRVFPATSASIPCTRAIWMASRVSTISTPSTSSPNGNW